MVLIRPNGQRMISIRMVPQFAFKEQVSWYLSHCPKHARIIYPPSDELFLYHPFACLYVVDNHYSLPMMISRMNLLALFR